jgi:hypothetical protein
MGTTANTPTERNTRRDRPTFYTVAEAARLLRVDPAAIYRAIRAGAFPAVRWPSRPPRPARAWTWPQLRPLDASAARST